MSEQSIATGLAVHQSVTDFLDPERIALIKNTVAKGATDTELDLFLYYCQVTRLNPLARQIYAVRRRQWNSQTRQYEEQQVIQVSIDGFRLIAERSGEYAGQTPPQWCGKDGIWKDVWLLPEPPAAAKIGVYRRGFVEAVMGVALYSAYVQTNANGEAVSRWKTDPANMLLKTAEALALRKAFPQELSGLYTGEEMSNVGEIVDGQTSTLPPVAALNSGNGTPALGTGTQAEQQEQPPQQEQPTQAATKPTAAAPGRKTASDVAKDKADKANKAEKAAKPGHVNPVVAEYLALKTDEMTPDAWIALVREKLTVLEAHEVQVSRRGLGMVALEELVTDDLKKLLSSLAQIEENQGLSMEQTIVVIAAQKLIAYYEGGGARGEGESGTTQEQPK